MKKRDLASLALIGISAGSLVAGCQKVNKTSSLPKQQGHANYKMSPEMRAFYTSLNPEAQRQFMQLDARHKIMAMEMAEQKCSGENECSGMGGCATATHKCAGENSCKGEGGPPIKDPNKAVEVQYHQQMQSQN